MVSSTKVGSTYASCGTSWWNVSKSMKTPVWIRHARRMTTAAEAAAAVDALDLPHALDLAIEIDDIALVLARAIEAVTEGAVEIDATSPTVDATTGTAGTIDTLAETTIDAIATTDIAIDIKKHVYCCK